MVKKTKLCCMDTYSFIVYIKTCNIYKHIAEDVENRFGTSDYKLDKPLPNGENKNLIRLMRDELGSKIMTKFLGLSTKTGSYLIDDGSEDKKAKGTKSVH